MQLTLGSLAAVPRTLFTFGYEGCDIDRYIARLQEAGVQTLVDVRELPLSRKRRFSKHALAAALREAGISYVHEPQLGCPRDIRDRYKHDANWKAYTRQFTAYLNTQGQAVRELAELARTQTACLMCFEADFDACHRTYVARAARRVGAPNIVHLTARTAVPDPFELPARVAA